MKSLMLPAANIITSTAITIAAIMTATSSTIPTAVMTKLSEKTISITAICCIFAMRVVSCYCDNLCR